MDVFRGGISCSGGQGVNKEHPPWEGKFLTSSNFQTGSIFHRYLFIYFSRHLDMSHLLSIHKIDNSDYQMFQCQRRS